jgi:prepilin-type N-terminal cleavage/methylation domain-containing protein
MRPTAHHGFTLLELLVAVTISLGIAAAMVVVTTSTLAFWRRAQDAFTTGAQAKLALDFLERDLQAGIFRIDPTTTWFAVTVANSPAALTGKGWQVADRMKPATTESLELVPALRDGREPTVAAARFGQSGAWLRFLTANVESAGSFPVAVSYQIVRRPVSGAAVAANSAAVRYSLFRSAVATDVTFLTGNDVLTGYGSNAETSPPSRSAASLTNPNTTTDTLLTNAVDFGVWLYVRDGRGALRRIFPSDATDLLHAARDAGPASDASRYPEVADVMVRLLSEDGARQVAAMEQGRTERPAQFATDAAWWWSVVESNSTVHVRRVEWKGGSP